MLQILVITFMGRFFQLYQYWGLNPIQWLISVGLGALTVPVSIFLRLLPCCKPETHREFKRARRKDETEEEYQKSIQTTNRKYIQPVRTYNHESSLPFTKLASKK